MKFPFEVIDLTHAISQESPSWEGGCGFEHNIILDYKDCDEPAKFRVQEIKMLAGIGTHMDSPAHCIPGGKTIDALPLQDLIAPCVVVDISKQAHEAYQCSLEDLKVFERKYGKIPKNSFVIIHTGWGQYWSQPKQYRNNLNFPSISLEAALFLLERDIQGLGIDTLSADRSDSGYPVHQAVLGADKYLIENIAHSENVPPMGSFSLALPLLIKGATEAPMRLIAIIMKEK
jgi:kynurenine formamidase